MGKEGGRGDLQLHNIGFLAPVGGRHLRWLAGVGGFYRMYRWGKLGLREMWCACV